MTHDPTPMNAPSVLERTKTATWLRSGAAAKLAGLPVTTLRVWERRYGVVAAPKTTTGQRQYTAQDVQRLRVLKQLTDRGHAIGTIAALPLNALHALAAGLPDEQTLPAPHRRVVVVGRAAVQLMRSLPDFEVLVACDELGQADAQIDPAATAEVLLVHLSSLQPTAVDRLLSLATRLGVGRLVVLYAFGAQTLAESLRATGAAVRRDPTASAELARLLTPRPHAPSSWLGDLRAEPRSFDDQALTELASRPPTIACECTRHVAEIVMQLASFERYSAECASSSPSDLMLHRHLTGLTGVARTLLEQGLQRLVAHIDAGAEPTDGPPQA
jgi:hypothetical protein